MKATSILLAMVVAGCEPHMADPPPFTGHLSKGQTYDKMNADAVACRNDARVITGVNGTAWFWQAYSDCMISKGYEPG
ncbi:MAG: hypothetical protein JSR91_21365 [Proteobacteria bacterium]|nr:hypothetical protein [Pseudomonadota bacterium]